MTTFGYARVSTMAQDLEIQLKALRAAGCGRMFSEKISGAKSDNRPQLCRLMKLVEVGDVIIVTRLDRLARSTRDFLNIVHELNEAGAKFRSIAEPWADTTSDLGQLVLTVLAGIAEFERKLIRARTEAGIQRARENKVQFGRKPRLNAQQKLLIAELHGRGQSMADIAERFEVGVATVHRALHGAAS
jgi:DNA invertase Pin-like site-specific DNA recombinase